MNQKKITLNRVTLGVEFIESRQNFENIMVGYYQHLAVKRKFIKPLFYGPIGISSIALVLSTQLNQKLKNTENEIKYTQQEKNITKKI
jgi:hypothetical protein